MTLPEIIMGSILLSIVHFLIPSHWLPLVTLSKAERWSLPETLRITLLTAFAHTLSTLALGLVIGMIGYRLSTRYEAFTEMATPLILLAMGLLYFGLDLNHAGHAHLPDGVMLRRKSKAAIVLSLCVAMFFSPCFEIETFFLSAGAFGWKGIGIISAVYLLITMTGIMLMVWAGYQSVRKFRWRFLERHEKKVTGFTLMALGLLSFFIH